MKQEELATKQWIDAVHNDDAVYETFKLILSDELVKCIPEFKDNHKFIFVSVTGSHNYGTAHVNSDVDLKVVYTESLRANLSIIKPNKLNFHIQKELNYYDSIIPLDIQFIHISTFLKQLSKSNYAALEVLTSNYIFYSWFSNSEINDILKYYNYDIVKNDIVSIIKNNETLSGKVTEGKYFKRLYAHFLLLSNLKNSGIRLLLRNSNFWDVTWNEEPSEEQLEKLLTYKISSSISDEEYVKLLNDHYLTLGR